MREVTAAAFGASREIGGDPALPEESGGRPEVAARERGRTRHLARTDPGGCWIAEEHGTAVGTALALRREGLWALSLFCVLPEAQGKGVGRLLLDHAVAYGRGCLRGMIVSTPDPRAVRRYHAAGFKLHPMMTMSGTIDRAALPDPGAVAVHLGDASHQALLDSVDRATRGSAHGPDHQSLLRTTGELLVADTLGGSGYCYRDGGRVVLLAATTRRLATALLTEALLRVPPGEEAVVGYATAEQDWAVDVGLAGGLRVRNRGFLALRGTRPPAPYLPSNQYL